MNGNHLVKRWHGLRRDQVLWQPLVQSCLCDGCGLCVTSCPTGALAFDFHLNIPFVDPLRCLIGCSICAILCPQDAILLPDRQDIQKIIRFYRLENVSREELHQHRKEYARVLPQAIYPDDVDESHN